MIKMLKEITRDKNREKSPQSFEILNGYEFFHSFSILHILWAIWMLDMFLQIVPVKNKIALGSQKLFANRCRPIREKINYKALRDYVVTTTKAAYKIYGSCGKCV